MIWLWLVILLLSSGLASGSETALFALDRLTLNRFRQSRGRLRLNVYRLMRRPRRVLMTVLITNTGVNVAIFSTSYIAIARLESAGPLTGAVGSLIVLFAVILFGEMLPKAIALSSAKTISPLAGCVVSGLELVLAPVLWALGTFLVNPITRLLSPLSAESDVVSADELRLLVEQSAGQGLISSMENEMLQAVVTLGDSTAREVMTPRVDIEYAHIDDDPAAVLASLGVSPRRELPVCGRDIDDIRGMLLSRDLLLNPRQPIRKLLRPANFVPEQVRLVHLIRHFREEQIRSAVVVDEYGGTTGLVSIKDVLERIVGSLADYDTLPAVATERIDENTYRLPGDVSVRLWAERFGAGDADRRVHTLAGLVLARLGRLPQENDSVRTGNLTLTVERMRNRRIESLILHRDEPAAPGSEDTP